jgi:hypothetical protein
LLGTTQVATKGTLFLDYTSPEGDSLCMVICKATGVLNQCLLETPLHKTEKETYLFLQGVLGGRVPTMQFDGDFKSYDLDNQSFHIEYKIYKDTCVMTGIRYKSDQGAFLQMTNDIQSETESFGENRLKKMSGRRLIYTFAMLQKAVTAISYDFAVKKVANSGQ